MAFLILFSSIILSTIAYAAENELVWTGERSIYYGGIVGAAEEFTKKTGIKVTTIPGGCSTAAKGVKSGKVDVGGLCCKPKEEELKAGYKAYPLAYEALVIIVNNANPITNLTVQQVRDIFSGKIKNWKEVGGQDKPIKVVTRLHCKDREDNWKQILNSPELFTKDRKDVKEDQDVLLAVGNEPNSIAYISLTMVNRKFAKVLSINGITPSRESLIDNTYPWKGTDYMITMGEPTGNKKKFIEFLLTDGRKFFKKDVAFVDEVKPVVAKKKGLKEKPLKKKL
ncbi:MAG: substrate-binding domain-containing protein [Nitrospirae bacterium]|nr:substrate-binding domain-containing protein [Nitrospirota bacterium]